MQKIVVKSFAKLNLFLHILGVRGDGYHDLDGIMTGISIYDTIRISKADDFSLNCDIYTLANENNLSIRAARLFFEELSLPGGVDIYINKHIPPMSGMGGGSANAANTLLALNELYSFPMQKERLFAIAENLGADVPFFINGHPCRANGTGEILTPVANNLDVYYLVLKPTCGIDTAACFKLFDKTNKTPPNGEVTARAIERGNLLDYINNSVNMLCESAYSLCPEIEMTVAFLKNNGALFAQMTGSGSAVFGVYNKRLSAIQAFRAAKQNPLFEFSCIAKKVDSTYKPVLYID